MENIKWRVVYFPRGQHCCGGDLAKTSVTHGWPGFTWPVRLSPCSLVIPCAMLTWLVEDVQSLTAPQEHDDGKTLARKFAVVSVKISSSRMQSK